MPIYSTEEEIKSVVAECDYELKDYKDNFYKTTLAGFNTLEEIVSIELYDAVVRYRNFMNNIIDELGEEGAVESMQEGYFRDGRYDRDYDLMKINIALSSPDKYPVLTFLQKHIHDFPTKPTKFNIKQEGYKLANLRHIILRLNKPSRGFAKERFQV